MRVILSVSRTLNDACVLISENASTMRIGGCIINCKSSILHGPNKIDFVANLHRASFPQDKYYLPIRNKSHPQEVHWRINRVWSERRIAAIFANQSCVFTITVSNFQIVIIAVDTAFNIKSNKLELNSRARRLLNEVITLSSARVRIGVVWWGNDSIFIGKSSSTCCKR